MLKIAVSGLLNETQCQPEPAALAAAAGLQLGSVSAATARNSLPDTHCVPALLSILAEIDPKACLGLLRKWYPVPPTPDSVHPARSHVVIRNQMPAGSVEWRAHDFGISPKSVIERLLYQEKGVSHGGCGGPSQLFHQLSNFTFLT